MTTYEAMCEILGELWINYKAEQEFKDFIEYNDLGLPLAYAIANGIVQSSSISEQYITETFSLLLTGLSIEEDTGFESLDSLLGTGL